MEAEKNRADILEVDRASGRYRIFASGLGNPNGLTFKPTSGRPGRSSTNATRSVPTSCPTT
jgi:hypothetical protein